MHFLKDSAEALNEAEKGKVDGALDPPLTLILSAGAAYGAAFFCMRRAFPKVFRVRRLVLQMAASTPAAVFLCVGGQARCHVLLRHLTTRRSNADNTKRCVR